jgi:hypothetical protein
VADLILIDDTVGLNVLLGVVPSTTGVSGRSGEHSSRDNGSGKEASNEERSEDEAEEEGRKDDLSKRVLTSSPGAIISMREALAEMAMQAS